MEEPMYSSSLTTNSQFYSRDCHGTFYYQAVEIYVVEGGNYTLYSESSFDPFGYIYEDKFIPYNPSINRVTRVLTRWGCTKFKLFAYLQTKRTYILVVTTFHPNEVGPFSIVATGPNNVTLKYTSEYVYHVLQNE